MTRGIENGEPFTEMSAVRAVEFLRKKAINGQMTGVIVIYFNRAGDVFYRTGGRINRFTALGILSMMQTKFRDMLADFDP